MGEEPLTRPENYAEIMARRRDGKKVIAAGGCPYCKKRVEGWDRTGCGVGSVFPLCTKGNRPKFELDEESIKALRRGLG
jgi:hypothetical protein